MLMLQITIILSPCQPEIRVCTNASTMAKKMSGVATP